jgi:MoxR-like ATPase
MLPDSVDTTLELLARADYVADRSLATVVYLALNMGRPLFLEGEAGVGKTEVAKVLAQALDTRLVRLQCYEGLDVSSAVYEWDYSRQMLEIRLAEAAGVTSRQAIANELFSERFLLRRPLMQAIDFGDLPAPVLLIDELDRADEPFEAFLLEILSEFQVSVPELGVFKAPQPPIVVLTSNRTREIHDAVKRRCLYHWIDYPEAERELEILRRKAPAAAQTLARQVVAFVQRLRTLDLFKSPGIAESIDWCNAIVALDRTELDAPTVDATLGALLKYQDDMARVRGTEAGRILAELPAVMASA